MTRKIGYKLLELNYAVLSAQPAGITFATRSKIKRNVNSLMALENYRKEVADGEGTEEEKQDVLNDYFDQECELAYEPLEESAFDKVEDATVFDLIEGLIEVQKL
jgi:hypothetical protein